MTSFSNANRVCATISPVKKPMTLISIIREEGRRLAETHCGFKYLMAWLGTCDDFEAGRIPFIRLKQSPSLTDVIARGGKVTYKHLLKKGLHPDDIEKIFNNNRRKPEDMKEGSYRCKMYGELQKMLANFNPDDYYAGKRASVLSDYVEKHSKGEKPASPTTFCQAVARMMTLMRLAHQESSADERNSKKAADKIAKKVANDKRTTKYNMMKDQMGVDKFNAMKARDQAASAKKAAEKVSQAGMIGRTAKFVEWRTQTPEGKMFDICPRKGYVTPITTAPFAAHGRHTKHLGYTGHDVLAQIVRRCLDNTEFTGLHIKFAPDPGDASSQLYQYAPLSGQRPALLRNTRDADTARTFRVCGMLKHASSPPEYYIQPDQQNGLPMRSSVYYSLPPQWKDYEQWTGFGVMGNPQKSTSMETLFKIVDNNITEVTFFAGGARYQVSYSKYTSKSVDQIFNGIVKIPTPAEAAAAAAEVEKKRRAKEARAKEAERQRRFRQEQMNRMLGGNHRGVFNQFFGVGTKQEDPTTKAKVNLAIKLAQGDIDQTTFNAAMDAFN